VQKNDGQLNRPSEPESHSLFSVFSGLKMGTSSDGNNPKRIYIHQHCAFGMLFHGTIHFLNQFFVVCHASQYALVMPNM
jgi:hypothetical protein